MAVKIKLKRLGRTRVPTYRIVVADARTKRDGRAIEEIGKYHPKEEPSLIEVDSERAQHWLSVGAQPTEPVLSILKITGDWQKFKGEPGAEGTLRTAEPREDRKERFAAALKDAAQEDTGSSGSRAGGRSKKPDQARGEGKAEQARGEDKADSVKARSKGSATQPVSEAGDEPAAAASGATAASDAAEDAAPTATAASEPGEQ